MQLLVRWNGVSCNCCEDYCYACFLRGHARLGQASLDTQKVLVRW